MIRRGLQIFGLVGITALGAASSFASVGETATRLPEQIVVQNTVINGVNFNGLYLKVGDLTALGSQFWQRYTTSETQVPPVISFQMPPTESTANNFTIRFHTSWPTNATAVHTFQSPQSALNQQLGAVSTIEMNNLPGGGSGQLLVTMFVSNDFREAFPDWESAAGKIPLGFTLAMSFWAVCVAAAISMRWVRDLVSAAT
jgi:hypothetical protein